MKLRRKHIIPPNGRSECLAISRSGRHDGLIHWLRKKAVDEINIATVLDPFIKRTIGLRNLKLVPADLRDLQTIPIRETNDTALEQRQTGGATVKFFAALEQSLITHTDAQERAAGLDELPGSLQHGLL